MTHTHILKYLYGGNTMENKKIRGIVSSNIMDSKSAEERIIDAFCTPQYMQRLFFILSSAESNTSDLMLDIANKIVSTNKNWIHVPIDSTNIHSIMEQINFSLSQLNKFTFRRFFMSPSKVQSYEHDVSKTFHTLTENKHKILITIDGIENNPSVSEFMGAFQIWLRENISVYLLSAGTYENIMQLQDEPTLGFLYRSPKLLIV